MQLEKYPTIYLLLIVKYHIMAKSIIRAQYEPELLKD